MSIESIQHLAYIAASIFFILGIKNLGAPGTARRGNLLSVIGMAIAILATILSPGLSYSWMIGGAILGSLAGYILAVRVEMTAMPQMVALLNGFGGLASALVGTGDFLSRTAIGAGGSDVFAQLRQAVDQAAQAVDGEYRFTIALSVAIGSVTLTGSLVAFGKLQEILSGSPVNWPGKVATSALVAATLLGGVIWLTMETSVWPLVLILGAGIIFGFMLVLPIGGADMPVVIALLNSYSGMAAAATGFVLTNDVLIVAGALVGTSGLFLTQIMCKAMNRSLTNVMFGAFGSAGDASGQAEGEMGTMRETTVEDVAIQMSYASQVVFVPGYGMAMAQAQHAVRELADVLEKNGVAVKYAIHPVAGRMPGHMNVLLAEAQVPYSQLYELEQINPEFKQTDVAVVIGANDVVNPDARDNAGSPIYGMPILEVDKSRSVIVLKRGRGRGFAGIENPLFFKENTQMLFGDAKQSLMKLVQAVDTV